MTPICETCGQEMLGDTRRCEGCGKTVHDPECYYIHMNSQDGTCRGNMPS